MKTEKNVFLYYLVPGVGVTCGCKRLVKTMMKYSGIKNVMFEISMVFSFFYLLIAGSKNERRVKNPCIDDNGHDEEYDEMYFQFRRSFEK